MFKTVPQVYRDCLRLIDHIAGRSRKGDTMRALVQQQFRMHAAESNEAKVEALKKNAMGGLANYLTMESLGKLQAQGGASGIRDRTAAANVRKSLGADAEAAESATATATASPSSSSFSSPAASASASSSSSFSSSSSSFSSSASAVADADIYPVDPASSPALPPLTDEVAQLQHQLRTNKALRLELERRAREGKLE